MANKVVKIKLDGGHGPGSSYKRGYIGPIWKNEGDGNYYFSLLLKKELEAYGITVSLTRPNIQQNPSLEARGQSAQGYDLFISLHTNAGGGTGVEIYEDVNSRATTLNTKLCESISKHLGIKNRGVKYRYGSPGSNYYGVLRNNKAKAGMLIEHAFHDNKYDVNSYEQKAASLAKIMASDIANYFGIIRYTVSETPAVSISTIAPLALISYVKHEDLAYINPLVRWLTPSYTVVIAKSGQEDFKKYAECNWRIGIGGDVAHHSTYLNYHISGANRLETENKIKEFVNDSTKRDQYKLKQ